MYSLKKNLELPENESYRLFKKDEHFLDFQVHFLKSTRTINIEPKIVKASSQFNHYLPGGMVTINGDAVTINNVTTFEKGAFLKYISAIDSFNSALLSLLSNAVIIPEDPTSTIGNYFDLNPK
ncbi:MAG: hypothetical protein LCH44_13915 [Bacteroidetes bacterium]|nr:hypothetical protein [Bacteroidota bacterium]